MAGIDLCSTGHFPRFPDYVEDSRQSRSFVPPVLKMTVLMHGLIEGIEGEVSHHSRRRRSALPLRIFVLSSADRGIVGIQSTAGWFKTKG